MNTNTAWWIALTAATAMLPAMSQAQPAPLNNPVVARAPCSVGADSVRAPGEHMVRPMRARNDAVTGRDHASARRAGGGIVVPTMSTTDIRREIVVELRGTCN